LLAFIPVHQKYIMPSKQRIAFVANTSWSIYKFRLQLLKTFIQKGFEVYVLAPRDKYSVFFDHTEGIFFIELNQFKSKSISLPDDLRLYKELLSHYNTIRPQLIFHYTIKANIYGSLAAARAGCRGVAIITGLGYMFTGKSIFKFIASFLYRFALKKTSEVWFLNPDDQQIFIKAGMVPEKKTFLLPGEGVDSNTFYAVPYEYNAGPVSFLLIARLIEHKGVYEFAAAAEILHAKKLNARFSILGFFDDQSAVAIPPQQIAQWENSQTIQYLGETDNVIPFIAAADCIVLPSYREGLPLSLLEGASMCKALIATDVPGCRQIIRNGLNGFLCLEKDPADLAAKMETYCMLPAAEKKAMGLAGRELVLSHFTQEIVTGIYLEKLNVLKQ
jgi:glycosyltransferase involved in cell wall biosynthesis